LAGKAAARWGADRACNDYDGVQEALQGVSASGKTESVCFSHITTTRMNFFVQKLDTAVFFDMADS
jgi:hypothetical protein